MGAGRTRRKIATGIARLRSNDSKFRRDLREAIRDSSPGEVVEVHAVGCPMADQCTCRPVTLVVGPSA